MSFKIVSQMQPGDNDSLVLTGESEIRARFYQAALVFAERGYIRVHGVNRNKIIIERVDLIRNDQFVYIGRAIYLYGTSKNLVHFIDEANQEAKYFSWQDRNLVMSCLVRIASEMAAKEVIAKSLSIATTEVESTHQERLDEIKIGAFRRLKFAPYRFHPIGFFVWLRQMSTVKKALQNIESLMIKGGLFFTLDSLNDLIATNQNTRRRAEMDYKNFQEVTDVQHRLQVDLHSLTVLEGEITLARERYSLACHQFDTFIQTIIENTPPPIN